MRITILRHGETIENSMGIFQGHSLGRLSQRGIEQAHEAKERLSSLKFDEIYCSDLQRTVDTANIVNQVLNLPIHYTPILRERDMGKLTGRPIEEINLPGATETVEGHESMRTRVYKFLDMISTPENRSKSLLIISHGMFLTIFQSVLANLPFEEIKLMDNCEFRQFEYNYI